MTTEEEQIVNGSVLSHAAIDLFQNDQTEKVESNGFTDSRTDSPVDTQIHDITVNNNISATAPKAVEKLRIVIPPMASPSSYYSSSSESHSPAHTKKVRKRFCCKCDIRFKHTADWLTHLRAHVTQPRIELTPVDESNPFYEEYLSRAASLRKRAASTELNTGALKIRLKIPHDSDAETSRLDDSWTQNRHERSDRASRSPHKENSIRILTAQEIKLSPPRMSHEMPCDAMVSLGANPFGNNSEPRHFECPPLDGLSQFVDETETGESTEQLLRKLLLNSDVMPETNNFDAPSNEFISIENLAHMCSICKSSFPNSSLLSEHERLTGHNLAPNDVSILEPIQEMIVEPLLPFAQPSISPLQQTNLQQQHQQQQQQQQQHLQHQRQQQQQMRQMNFGPPPMQVGSYGQPPVLPLDQMANHHLRNFPNNQMPRFGPMMPVRRRTPPPLYRANPVLNNNNGPMPNQPMNMTPFMSMNPDMYNPQPSNQPMGPSPFTNSQLASRLMAPLPSSRLRSRLSMPTHPHISLSRPNFQRPFMPPPPPLNNSSVPLNNFSPPLDMPNGRMQPNQRPNPVHLIPRMETQRSNPVHLLPRMETQRPKENNNNNNNNRSSPIISMAPPSAGLPIIQSVSSGANVTTTDSNRFHISNQITLSVKPKENAGANADPNAANNAVNILANRGILIKPTNKQSETTAIANNKPETQKAAKCGTAEEAVQKLQLNNSVSIISKKRSSTSSEASPTIDLSNDEDKESETTIQKTPTLARKTTIKCPIKSCNARFVNVMMLRQHTRTQHRLPSRSMKCVVCSEEFPSPVELRIHHLKEHYKSQLGIPVIDLRKARTCHKLIEMGIVNFIPIENYTRHTENAEMGLAMPIISIDGSSKNSLLNLLGADELSLLPLNKIHKIPKPLTTPQRTAMRTSAEQRPVMRTSPEQTALRTPPLRAERGPLRASEKPASNTTNVPKKPAQI